MSKKPDGTITISPSLQRLFVAIVLLGWLIEVIVLLHNYLASGFIGAGTWTFEATVWVQPIVFFAVGFFYAARRYGDWHRRSFLAMLLTVLGMSVSAGLTSLDNFWYFNMYTKAHPVTGNSYWTAFGNEWVVMLVSLFLYGGLLVWLNKRKI